MQSKKQPLVKATTEEKKQMASSWFKKLRDDICTEFGRIEQEYVKEKGEVSRPSEPSARLMGFSVENSGGSQIIAGTFKRTPWTRKEGGGGEMSVMKGSVFEKVGVNISTVEGEFSEAMRKEVPGADKNPKFWASGISLVAHMRSPLVPAVHMNTRMVMVGDEKPWFGGGADLTPMYPNERNSAEFHAAFKATCDTFDADYYPKFKKWCDEYFYLKHRNEPRGAGGIFYDYLNSGNWENDFAFTQAVGKSFYEIYPKLVRRHMFERWTVEQREHQLYKRGRYVEFNLLYDRGTRFGLMTGGNVDAIFMSLPPEAKW